MPSGSSARFGTPTEPQEQGWPEILAGRTTLISAPTGSGKTLAAFLICIDRLVRKALDGELRDRTEVLYVSPLKALGNDIQKNLEGPLGEILALAAERGLLMPEIRTAVRTGDTLMKERREMLKRPPHILVTTPESLYILLTANSSRAILSHVETVIVDEIHAVADDKRGAHLTLSLERLDLLANRPTRIGLSATQKPIEEIAHFLTGAGRPAPAVVNIGHRRKLDLAVEVPPSELGPIASNEMWGEIYDRIAELALQHRSTLVFVNTRRLAERVALHLGERIGEELVAAHHGSLARKLRLNAERKLKNGEIRLLVATASLELGIDIGNVDLVCQINSPRSIAVALQRVGRAGHWRGAVPKGRLFATTRDDLVECAAAVRAIQAGRSRSHSDSRRAARHPGAADRRHVQLARTGTKTRCSSACAAPIPIAICSARSTTAFWRCCRKASRPSAAAMARICFATWSTAGCAARRGARLAAITSGGAIPDTALFTVVAQPEEIVVGTRRRRLRGREQRRRHHAAGQHLVAHSPRRVQLRTRAGGRCARRAADDSVLARRSSGAHRRAVACTWPNCASASARCCRTRRRCRCPTQSRRRRSGMGRASPKDRRSGDEHHRTRLTSAHSVCAESNPVPKCRTPSPG